MTGGEIVFWALLLIVLAVFVFGARVAPRRLSRRAKHPPGWKSAQRRKGRR